MNKKLLEQTLKPIVGRHTEVMVFPISPTRNPEIFIDYQGNTKIKDVLIVLLGDNKKVFMRIEGTVVMGDVTYEQVDELNKKYHE